MNAVFFWIFSAIAVAGGLTTVTRRNPLSSAIGLAVSLVAVAGLFAMLSAHLLFILQILVYAGAIIVLIIFVIMLINQRQEDLDAMRLKGGRFLVSLAICGAGCALTLRALRGLPDIDRPISPAFGTAADVGRITFSAYLIPFEVVGLILLVGILGAVVIAKRGE